MWALYWTSVMKREPGHKKKLWLYYSVFVSTLKYGNSVITGLKTNFALVRLIFFLGAPSQKLEAPTFSHLTTQFYRFTFLKSLSMWTILTCK